LFEDAWGGSQGDTVGDEIVTGITTGYFYDIARFAEFAYIFV
jgi:hypothetical protein